MSWEALSGAWLILSMKHLILIVIIQRGGGVQKECLITPLRNYACVCARTCLLSHVRLFAIPWTAACQVPLSRGLSRQEY